MSKADVVRRAAPLILAMVEEYEQSIAKNSGSLPAESDSRVAGGAAPATSGDAA